MRPRIRVKGAMMVVSATILLLTFLTQLARMK